MNHQLNYPEDEQIIPELTSKEPVPSCNRISVCLIAKNEEKYIENCIKSVLPVAWEIIVLDTGSTDRTMEICRDLMNPPPGPLSSGHGAGKEGEEDRFRGEFKLYETTWEDDFSKARNESVKYATGDWILFLGADEVLTEDTRKNLLLFLQKKDYHDPKVVYCFKILTPQPGGLITTSYFRQAIFKNGAGIYFERPVHEQLTNSQNDLVNINCPFFTIYHMGQLKSSQALRDKTEKYKKQLLLAIENNRDKSDNYYYYHHLGNVYSQNNQNEEALKAFYMSHEIYQKSGRGKKDLVYGSILIKLIGELIYNHERYQEALPFIDELLEISPDFPDALFYKAYSLQNLDQTDQAIMIYEKLLALYSQDIDLNPLGIVSQEKSLVPVLLLEMSNISLMRGDKEKGLVYLEYAYKIFPESPPILLHLCKFHLLESNLNEAVKYFLQGTLLTPEEKEDLEGIKFTPDSLHFKTNLLRLLRKLETVEGWSPGDLISLKDKIKQLSVFVSPTISVCLITKNEEKYIEDCLKSVLPVASEIIVLDTGSTDRTREIASKYATVYETVWSDDFSKARNESIQYAKGNWILWLDADEVLTDSTRKRLIAFLAETNYQNEPVVFCFKNLNSKPGTLVDTSYFKQNLFRNGYGFYFISPIHEHLELESGTFKEIDCPEFSITHLGNFRTKEDLSKKADKYINLLFKAINESKEKDRDYFYYFHYLGDTYANLEQYEKAMEYYNLSYEQAKIKTSLKFSTDLLIIIIKELLFIHERFQEVIPLIEKLTAILPALPDAAFYLAYARHQLGFFREAAGIYDRASVLAVENLENTLGVNILGNLLQMIIPLETGRCYLLSGDNEKGLKYLEDCYHKDETFLPVLYHLIRFHLLKNNLEKAVFYYLQTGFNFSANEIQSFENTAKLAPEEAQYKSLLLRLLQEVDDTSGFTGPELLPVRKKVKELSPKVSVCIITDNDQENIEKCIQSVLPIAYEIIIIDAGSTDKTKEIVGTFHETSLHIILYESEPNNDISKFKNEAFNYATGDWILTINPNEELTGDSKKNLLPFLVEQPYHNSPVVFCLKHLKKQKDFTFPVSSFNDNLFKTGFEIHSVRPVSEHLYNLTGNISLINCPFLTIQDHQNSVVKINSLIQSIQNEINLDQNSPDNYYYYLFLGDAYKAAGDNQCLEAYIRSYELFNQTQLPKNNAFYGNILSKLLQELVLKKKEYHKAMAFCEELLNISPSFQDALFFLGYCKQNTGDIKGAVEIYEYTYDLFNREDINPLGISSLEDNIFLKLNIELGKCFIKLGNKSKGLAYFEQIYKIAPEAKEILTELSEININT